MGRQGGICHQISICLDPDVDFTIAERPDVLDLSTRQLVSLDFPVLRRQCPPRRHRSTSPQSHRFRRSLEHRIRPSLSDLLDQSGVEHTALVDRVAVMMLRESGARALVDQTTSTQARAILPECTRQFGPLCSGTGEIGTDSKPIWHRPQRSPSGRQPTVVKGPRGKVYSPDTDLRARVLCESSGLRCSNAAAGNTARVCKRVRVDSVEAKPEPKHRGRSWGHVAP